MRAQPLINRARQFGVRAYEHARHFTANVNAVVEASADVYGNVVRPLLHHQGYDTGGVETALLDGYAKFDRTRTAVQRIDRVLQR